MDIETIERLLSDLEEAKGSFDILISQMKSERIEYPYDELTKLVNDCFNAVNDCLNRMKEDIPLLNNLKEKNKDYIYRVRFLRGVGITLKILALSIILDLGRKTNQNYLKGVACLGVVMSFIGTDLIMDDLKKMMAEPFKDKVSFNAYKNLKAVLKEAKRMAEDDIETMYSINRSLFEELEKASALSLNLKSFN